MDRETTLCFDVSIHGWTGPLNPAEPVVIHGKQVWPLEFTTKDLTEPLTVRFDDVQASLGQLPRMFIEPDGSFVWKLPQSGGQVDGQLYDGGETLSYVTLRGRCQQDELRSLLAVLGWPAQRLVFQITHWALFVDDEEFFRISRC